MDIDAELNPLDLAATLLASKDTTANVARSLIERHGSPDLALQALNEARDSAERLVASLALQIRTTPFTKITEKA
jgi:hypothetical protein